MGRSWKYLAAWLGMTITAVTVTWLGVRLGIAPAITADPPVAIDVDRRYTELRFGLEETASATTAPTTAPAPATKEPKARPSRSPSATPRTGAPTTRPAPSVRPASPVSSSSPAASSSPAPDRRPRFRVPADGGSVIVAYSPNRVDVVDADPLRGHVASVTRRSDTLVVIRLTALRHTSVINAYWNRGPAAQVVEEYR